MYDAIIIGGGASGLHLALKLLDDEFFHEKNMLLLEKSEKNDNDKTYCFWEEGEGPWDNIITQSWKTALVAQEDEILQLTSHPYRYKMLRSLDFYQYAKKRIQQSENIHWREETVLKLEDDGQVITKDNSYHGTYIFDSRPPDLSRAIKSPHHHTLLQHFKGWLIETTDPVFDVDQFTMMDFRVANNEHTAFMYVLPYSETKAMVEYTLFTQDMLEEESYDKALEAYIRDEIGPQQYNVLDVEQGVIPMTDFPYQRDSHDKIVKIGAAGGWIKPSSGYSFKGAEKKAEKIVQNLKKGRPPQHHLISEKHRFYDRLLLRILCQKNHLGPSLFFELYKRNTLAMIFKFLDEESHLLEDINIMASFDSRPFLKAMGELAVKKIR
ncbi:MAG TPA: lycopene cyclase family protein [Saprospiraceae bacterium]|nr:lycopene cyclase family protein [Saprospiraceae bacterium]